MFKFKKNLKKKYLQIFFYSTSNRLKPERIHLIWICRDLEQFLWFSDVLARLHEKVIFFFIIFKSLINFD